MTPLSPAKESRLNISTSPTEETSRGSFDQQRHGFYEVHTRTETTTGGGHGSSDNTTSNTTTSVDESSNTRDLENMPPSPSDSSSPSPPSAAAAAIKPQRHSRVMSGTAPSPLKILAGSETTERQSRSPLRKTLISPDKRFPIRVSNTTMESPRSTSTNSHRDRSISLDEAMRDNDGLRHAIEIFEDEEEDDGTGFENDDHPTDDSSTVTIAEAGEHSESYEDQSSVAHPDESMFSTFSTFSAVPNLTTFAKLGMTPTKHSTMSGMTPRGRPETVHEQTPRQQAQESGNTTNLLDFTDNQRFPHKSPSRRGNTSPSRANPSATPARQLSNLLDFDIPPLPTPRSIPTITPRELESLKSNYLSEISSLKASLSGKEAEVLSLKTAVGDAEKRVGEFSEQVREEQTLREQLAEDKDAWENSSREMEKVLRSVKEEIVQTTREREELESKLAESEARREAAETMAQEAERELARVRAGKPEKEGSPDKKAGAAATSKEVEIAVERVARELHALYKGKHETKVAALKKSYESRWEKKVHELEVKVEELTDENEKIRHGRDSMPRVDPAEQAYKEELKAQVIRDSAHIKELSAEVEKLEAVVTTIKEDNSELRHLLAQERVEKGELVQLAEEMMQMQTVATQEREREQHERELLERELQHQQQQVQQMQQMQQMQQQQQQQMQQMQQPPSHRKPATTPARAPGGPPARSQTENNFRNSLGRGSGLKAPGSIAARGVAHERTGSSGPATKGLPRPRPMSEFGPRSGIMSSIEKMGNYRGRE